MPHTIKPPDSAPRGEEEKMLTRGIEEQAARTEGLTNTINRVEPALIERPALRDQVNSIIHDGLTDMWLLLTGEELEALQPGAGWHDGRPIGMLWTRQVHMLTSKPAALETLRVLGIEML